MEKNLNQTNMKILTREEHRELHPLKEKKIPLVVTYSFDTQVNVYLLNTEEELKQKIAQQLAEEVRINIEEREMEEDVDFKQFVDSTGTYAKLEEYYNNGEVDVTEWSIGTLCF